jgi:hypothetical protein
LPFDGHTRFDGTDEPEHSDSAIDARPRLIVTIDPADVHLLDQNLQDSEGVRASSTSALFGSGCILPLENPASALLVVDDSYIAAQLLGYLGPPSPRRAPHPHYEDRYPFAASRTTSVDVDAVYEGTNPSDVIELPLSEVAASMSLEERRLHTTTIGTSSQFDQLAGVEEGDADGDPGDEGAASSTSQAPSGEGGASSNPLFERPSGL